MHVYQIDIGVNARYIRAVSLQAAKCRAHHLGWAADSAHDVGNYAPDKLGAHGYDKACNAADVQGQAYAPAIPLKGFYQSSQAKAQTIENNAQARAQLFATF